MHKAEIIAIGSELLSGKTLDTNSAHIGIALQEIGIDVIRKITVPDTVNEIKVAVKQAWKEADIILITGGLGPTKDDISKSAVVKALKLKTVYDPAIERHIREIFKKFRRKMPSINLGQAFRPGGSTVLKNNWGTAPGIYLKKQGKRLFMMPGVPIEAQNITRHRIIPVLKRELGRTKINVREINVFGVGESRIQEVLEDFAPPNSITLAFLPSLGSVKLRLSSRGSAHKLKAYSGKIQRLFKNNVYSTGDVSLEQALANLLRKKKDYLAVAESCTGGLLGGRIVNLAGASNVFAGGVIAYSNRAKTKLLGVPAQLVKKHGAVSIPVAEAMALGAARKFSCRCGVGITGVAGPAGGTSKKPVGFVCIACRCGSKVITRSHRFYGGRQMIRERAVRTGNFADWLAYYLL
jgi:nicotinamide-nucleotide amidase